jgi:hypothetical protein
MGTGIIGGRDPKRLETAMRETEIGMRYLEK